MWQRNLSLQEQFLLLCLNDETGQFEGPGLDYGLNAAALAELLLQERLTLAEDQVQVRSTTPLGDELLDLALTRLATSEALGSLPEWMRSLYLHPSTPRDLLLARLIRWGLLRKEGPRYLWVFHGAVFSTVPEVPEPELRHAVRGLVEGEIEREERLIVLLALLQAGQVLPLLFSPAELEGHQEKVRALGKAHPVAHTVGSALVEILGQEAPADVNSGAALWDFW